MYKCPDLTSEWAGMRGALKCCTLICSTHVHGTSENTSTRCRLKYHRQKFTFEIYCKQFCTGGLTKCRWDKFVWPFNSATLWSC